jgi:hypothetical protein
MEKKERDNWKTLEGLFIAGVRVRETEAVLSCYDTTGRPLTLTITGTCEKAAPRNQSDRTHRTGERFGSFSGRYNTRY